MTSHLKNSLYVDDLVLGAKNDKAFKVYKHTKETMSTGGFNLQKWHSNLSTLVQLISNMEKIPTVSTSDHEPGVVEEDLLVKLMIDQESTVTGEKQLKVLGPIWDTGADNLTFNLVKLLPVTKCSLLKWFSNIFDPLGNLAPYTIKLKIWFQELCMNKVDWDEELQGSSHNQWNVLVLELVSLDEV